MKNQEIYEKVKHIINSVISKDIIDYDESKTVDEICDSLNIVEILFKIEDEFGIDINDDEITQETTVKNIIDIVIREID